MINPQWLELPISRTNFHGPKDVRAIEVRLYIVYDKEVWSADIRVNMIQRIYHLYKISHENDISSQRELIVPPHLPLNLTS